MKYVYFSRPEGPCWGVVKGEDVFTLTKPPFDGVDYDGKSLPLNQCKLLAPCMPTGSHNKDLCFLGNTPYSTCTSCRFSGSL